MNIPTKHQIIVHDGQPMFVVLPYDEYLELTGQADEGVTIPLEVSKLATLEGKSLIRAWREFRGLTQEQVAAKVGVSRQAYTQMETKGSRPRWATRVKIAAALEVQPGQLTE